MKRIVPLLLSLGWVACQSTTPVSTDGMIHDLVHGSDVTRRAAVDSLTDLGSMAAAPLGEAVSEFDDEDTNWAALALARMGTDAEPAIPELVRSLERTHNASLMGTLNVSHALKEIGQASVCPLADALDRSQTDATRDAILFTLLSMDGDVDLQPARQSVERLTGPITSEGVMAVQLWMRIAQPSAVPAR